MVISSDNDDFKELEISLRECGMKKAEDYMARSGSAPPTVEGSLSAVGGFFSQDGDDALSGYSSVMNGKICMTEEELMSNPNYLSYYYSKANRNPRLPSPLISKEDWLSAQRFQNARLGFGGIGDRRKVQQQQSDINSLFSTQPVFNPQKEESVYGSSNAEWGGDGLIRLSEIGIDGRKNSFHDTLQDDGGHATPISTHPSRPASRNAFDGGFDKADAAEAQLSQQHKYVADGQGISGVKNTSASAFDTFASVVGASLSRSASPDPQLVVRTPSPRLPPIGEGKIGSSGTRSVNDSDSINGVSSNMNGPTNLVSALSGMSLSRGPEVNEENHLQSQIQQEIANHQNFLFNMHGGQNQIGQHPNLGKSDSGHLPLPFAAQTELRETYLKSHSSPILTNSGSFPHYQSADNTNSAITNDGLNVLRINPTMLSTASQIDANSLPPTIEKVVAAPVLNSRAFARGLRPVDSFGGTADLQNLKRMGYNKHSMDELYLQYLRTSHYAAQFAAFADPSMDGNYTGNSYTDMLSLRNAYTGALLPEKSQFGVPYIGKSSGMNQGYYDNPSFGLGGMSYSGYPFATPVLPNSLVGPRSPVMHSEWNTHFASGIRNNGSVMGSWHSKAGGRIVDTFASTLLEEFKDKSRSFALSEISGHVVEFSTDQYGSRFIQQKLGTASLAEKNMVFQEIIPHAFSLMTDVFGNYVIQKYFEHGSTTQRRKLANKLTGHVLQLSLQMYGCRVIQKAIEVLDLDQQTKMVAELDGNVMRCVGDQNGNHVIQKCIECIPQDAIQFIISSFYDEVVTLSTHPYGCRVIQRVLEHCNDSKTQHIMMDEIFQSVCMLAQDQYGNYVVQHILKFGKPHERSAVIKKLAGQIVQMSQHKFASNVVEKCLTYGSPLECQTLVNEMLGTTDENEPLQAMMKDQFGNYVVQKVLETCDDQQRERILSRIKVHLDALKKYTYGKHIVARVEKLVQAGERRIALQSPSLSS